MSGEEFREGAMPRPAGDAGSSRREALTDSTYRRLFEHVGDAIFVMDVNGNFVAVNETACTHVGYSRKELLRMRPEQINVPESADRFSERMTQVAREGHCTVEAVHLHRDGRHIPVEIHVRTVHYNGENFIVAVCRDVTARKQSEIEYRALIQAVGDGYWMVRISDGLIIEVNDRFCAMVGYSRNELLHMSVSDLEAIESPDDTAQHIRQVMERGHDLFETKHRHKNGQLVELELSVTYADIRGGVIFILARDISERKRQEAELKLASLIFNASTASIVATDADNRIVAVNAAFSRITGYEAQEVIGRDPRLLQSGRQSNVFYQEMWQTLERYGHWEGEWWNRRKDGEEYAEQVIMNVVRDGDGGVYRYVKVASDITEKKRLNDLIWRQAHYDTVTNLPNRQLFFVCLAGEIDNCRALGSRLALYFIDLDGFKQVNDEHGHAVGDKVLAEAAGRITGCVRSSDTVARLGGDEFTVILPGVADRARVEEVAQDIIKALAQPFRFGEVAAQISGSIGIVLFPDHGSDGAELVKLADQAMYAAKSQGKNTYSYVD